MQRLAYGPLALTPAVFWRLTPREFTYLCEGYRARDHAQWQKLAWVVAHGLHCFGWDGDPQDLLPSPQTREDMVAETAEFDAALGLGQSYEAVMAAQRAKGLDKASQGPG